MNRRRFLRGAAGALVSLPWLGSLVPRAARAQDGPPRRLVVIYTSNGHHVDLWTPAGGERDFVLSPVLAPLEPLRERIVVAHRLTGSYGHSAGHSETLTGWPASDESHAPPAGPSLDQLLAEGLRGQTLLPSLELGIDTGTSATGTMSFSAGALPIPSLANPRGAYDRLFNVASVDPEEAARRRRRKLSVLDFVLDDHRALQARLSLADRRVLDAHLTLLREHEQALQRPVEVATCALPEGPPAAADGSEYSFPESVEYHLDNVAAAFACDVTRVATVMIGRSGLATRYPWAGVDDDFHEIAHGNTSDALAKYERIDRWHAEQIAHLLQRLDALPEGEGTVLDNTLVMWTSEVGLHAFGHQKDNHGVLLGGGLGGEIATGRFVDLSGYHYHDLLLTIGRLMGADLASFGESGRRMVGPLLAA